MAMLNFSTTIGLEIDSNLMIPQNILATGEVDGSIYIEWDEVIEFDCNAESPYSDDCYSYVIEIDSYCCDYSWDGICQGEYEDCINGGGDDFSNDEFQNNSSDRDVILFSEIIFNEIRDREVVGYYLFRDGEFIHFDTETSYYDFDIVGGLEYCYSVSAVYENSQSEMSDESCASSSLIDFIPGDVNLDEILNILDIVIMVNMIFGLELPNYQIGDVNNDGAINVLDVIAVINDILDE